MYKFRGLYIGKYPPAPGGGGITVHVNLGENVKNGIEKGGKCKRKRKTGERKRKKGGRKKRKWKGKGSNIS